MKPFIFFILIICCSSTFAQRADPGKPVSSISSFNGLSITGGNDSFIYGNAINLNSAQYSEVSGSPFLNHDYASAYVVFKDGTKFKDVPVKFDMLNNQIDIERNKELLCLLALDSISYPDSNYQSMILKTGYPSINGHGTSSIYQIIAQNNKIQLLKYYHCHIATIKSLGLPDKSSFDVDSQYYLFNKATKIIKEIKLNKKSFSSAIADMGYSKVEIDNNKNIDFKHEKDVANLVSSVNF